MNLSEKMDSQKLRCNLCPHLCIMEEGQKGRCYARFSDGENISHIKLGAISSMAVEPIGKKPFNHFLGGTKTLTVGGWGCSLFCKYCENFSISQKTIPDNVKVISPSKLIEIAIEKHCKSISMSYNEPTLSYEYLIDLAEQCKRSDLKFLLKTNAFVNKDPWRSICQVTDAMNIDWKGSEEQFKAIAGVKAYVLQDRIKEAYESGVHLEISIPLYYKDEELEEEIKIVGEFLSSLSKDIPCHLLPIQPSFKYSNFIFNPENMKKAKDILSEYMNNIYTVI